VCRRCAQKKGGTTLQGLGRSAGGFTTKIHVLTEALGLPLDLVLSGGQQHDVTQAQLLLWGQPGEYVLADKGYDAQYVRDLILAQGGQPVLPERRNRKQPQGYDRELYKARYSVECFFNKLKYYRRVFSRFDKLGLRYIAFVQFAALLIWLR
jgi:transposase